MSRYTDTSTMPVQPKQCRTCPFREGVAKKYRKVRSHIAVSALSDASRICHNTGADNLYHEDTGKPEMLCRGARDLQIAFFHQIGFLSAPTDEAWAARVRELREMGRLPK